MRTRLFTVAGLAALLLAAPAAGRMETAAKPDPRLVLADRSPLTLRGTSFLRRERVRVLVDVEAGRRERRVVANVRGSFTVVFLDVALADRCSGTLWARAIGANGSRAVLKVPPQPLCPPPLRP